jgi:hypothetical protein
MATGWQWVISIFASCFQFNFAGKETSFDSCQGADEPGGSTPLGQKVPVFWTESSP